MVQKYPKVALEAILELTVAQNLKFEIRQAFVYTWFQDDLMYRSINWESCIEVKCSIGARDDLGRPTTTALENKINFMEYLKTLD